MDDMRENTIAVLKDLLAICKDEHSLFKAASEKTESEKLKPIFRKYAQEKEEHIIKLKSEIIRLGGNPDSRADALPESLNSIHEISFATSELINECIRTDDLSIKRYSRAIKEDILWEVVPLVAKQYFGSKNLHDQMIMSFNIEKEKSFAGVS